jgi:hypothetical protein
VERRVAQPVGIAPPRATRVWIGWTRQPSLSHWDLTPAAPCRSNPTPTSQKIYPRRLEGKLVHEQSGRGDTQSLEKRVKHACFAEQTHLTRAPLEILDLFCHGTEEGKQALVDTMVVRTRSEVAAAHVDDV